MINSTQQENGHKRSASTSSASALMAYLCTRYLLKFDRSKESDDLNTGKWVHISERPIKGTKRRFIDGDLIPYTKGKSGEWRAVIDELIKGGHIARREIETSANGRKSYQYTPLIDPVQHFDIESVKSEAEPLNELHAYMAQQMTRFKLPESAHNAFISYLGNVNQERQEKYLNAFKWIESAPELFFKVDDFAERVHTPFSSMERDFRPLLNYEGAPTSSIDLVTSQPLILAEILHKFVPGNQFTKWVRDGADIYKVMAEAAKLSTRDDGKSLFFQLIFARPKKQLQELFPRAEWVQWINQAKAKGYKHPRHERHEAKKYNVIAYYLQSTEAKIMRHLWRALKHEGMPFLSVHDEVIIPEHHTERAHDLFKQTMRENPTLPIPHARTKANKERERAQAERYTYDHHTTPGRPHATQ